MLNVAGCSLDLYVWSVKTGGFEKNIHFFFANLIGDSIWLTGLIIDLIERLKALYVMSRIYN